MEVVRVFGDLFTVSYVGKFSGNKSHISYKILDGGGDLLIVEIPVSYGASDIEYQLSENYPYPHTKSVSKGMYYISIRGVSEEQIKSVLNQF